MSPQIIGFFTWAHSAIHRFDGMRQNLTVFLLQNLNAFFSVPALAPVLL